VPTFTLSCKVAAVSRAAPNDGLAGPFGFHLTDCMEKSARNILSTFLDTPEILTYLCVQGSVFTEPRGLSRPTEPVDANSSTQAKSSRRRRGCRARPSSAAIGRPVRHGGRLLAR